MHFLRSLVFNIATYCGSFFSTLLALPTLVMPRTAMQWLARMLGFYIIFCVRFIINTKIIFKGLENIPKDRKFFIASAHQSICETFVFNAVLNAPIFIVKTELFKLFSKTRKIRQAIVKAGQDINIPNFGRKN